jgi:nucleotidyltransferase substrate binding protein (TIGR01987 family)
MNKPAIDLSKILKAQATFERFRRIMTNEDITQAGTVQAFEFCYELAWKIMKRFLSTQGIETLSPKDTFRKAALAKIIDDPEIWFDFQEKRNLTAHTYEEENLKAIVKILELFSLELNKIIIRIKAQL